MKEKSHVLQACKQLLEHKILDLKTEIDAVRDSAITDSKSSMGDKYETGREMMNQERNRLNGQLDVLLKQAAKLNAIDGSQYMGTVRQGSLVETKNGIYFISVPLGLVDADGDKVFAISSDAPVSLAMSGKKAGDSFTFQGKTFDILGIK